MCSSDLATPPSLDPDPDLRLAMGRLTPRQRTLLVLRHVVGMSGQETATVVGSNRAAVYAATKDGLASFGRSLRAGLHGRANVVTVYPGPTRTPHARRYSPDNSNEDRRMPPEQVAEAIVAAVRSGGSVVVPGWGNRFACAFGSLAPGLAERAMKKVIFDKIT